MRKYLEVNMNCEAYYNGEWEQNCTIKEICADDPDQVKDLQKGQHIVEGNVIVTLPPHSGRNGSNLDLCLARSMIRIQGAPRHSNVKARAHLLEPIVQRTTVQMQRFAKSIKDAFTPRKSARRGDQSARSGALMSARSWFSKKSGQDSARKKEEVPKLEDALDNFDTAQEPHLLGTALKTESPSSKKQENENNVAVRPQDVNIESVESPKIAITTEDAPPSMDVDIPDSPVKSLTLDIKKNEDDSKDKPEDIPGSGGNKNNIKYNRSNT